MKRKRSWLKEGRGERGGVGNRRRGKEKDEMR